MKQATNQEYYNTRAVELKLNEQQLNEMVEITYNGYGEIGKNTSAGMDGIHPII